MFRISAINLLLVGVLLLNLFMLGTSRIRALIQAAAVQGVVLGVMPILVGGHASWNAGLIAIATVLLKGSVIPRMLRRALREAQIKREIEPLIGLVPSMNRLSSRMPTRSRFTAEGFSTRSPTQPA